MFLSLPKIFLYNTLFYLSLRMSICESTVTHNCLLSSLYVRKFLEYKKLCYFFNRVKYPTRKNWIQKTSFVQMYTVTESNHKNLLDNLKHRGIIEDDEVYHTMLQVDRGHYIKENPYVDTPVCISHGVTISAPHMHALSLKKLISQLKPGSRALDVGSGSGYLTVCMAVKTNVVGNKDSFVLGIERIKELVDFSLENIKVDKPELLQLNNFKILHKNIYQLSEEEKKEFGLFDAIHVGASASELPQVLIDMLAENGKLVIPIDEGYSQVLFEIIKKDGKIIKNRLFDVCFVALKKN